MELSFSAPPLFCGNQVAPPSSVFRMVPESPTGQSIATCSLGGCEEVGDGGGTQHMEFKLIVVPLFC